MKLSSGVSKTLTSAAWLSMLFLASPQDQPLSSLPVSALTPENLPTAPRPAIPFTNHENISIDA